MNVDKKNIKQDDTPQNGQTQPADKLAEASLGDQGSKHSAVAANQTSYNNEVSLSGQNKHGAAANQDSYNNNEASWGDQWKHSAFNAGTYFWLNYVINTLFSVAIAYQFEMRYDKKLQDFSHVAGKKIADITGLNAEKEAKAFYQGTRGLTLTMGGTLLIPAIKVLEDHRHAIEFKVGHALDVMQDKMGFANTATKENLQEYAAIEASIKTGQPIKGLPPESMKLIGKQHNLNIDCDGKASFHEDKTPWWQMITSRAFAWAAAFGTNNLLGRVGLDKALNASQGKFTEAISSVLPVYKKMKDPDLFSKNLANDMVLCVSASVTMPFAMKILRNGSKKARNQPERIDCMQNPPQQQPAPDNSGTDSWAQRSTDSVVKPAMDNATWAKQSTDRVLKNASHAAAVESRRDSTSQQTTTV